MNGQPIPPHEVPVVWPDDGPPPEIEPEPETPPVPPEFGWNTAHDLINKAGPEHATALGLSMISEQLGWICDRMAEDG